jgi:hypothetical protein
VHWAGGEHWAPIKPHKGPTDFDFTIDQSFHSHRFSAWSWNPPVGNPICHVRCGVTSGRDDDLRRHEANRLLPVDVLLSWAYGVGCLNGYKTAAGRPPFGRATPETAMKLF